MYEGCQPIHRQGHQAPEGFCQHSAPGPAVCPSSCPGKAASLDPRPCGGQSHLWSRLCCFAEVPSREAWPFLRDGRTRLDSLGCQDPGIGAEADRQKSDNPEPRVGPGPPWSHPRAVPLPETESSSLFPTAQLSALPCLLAAFAGGCGAAPSAAASLSLLVSQHQLPQS